MTELLCHLDAYLKSFSAKVTGIDETNHAIVLDKTAFYPGGGGQLCDTGQLLTGNKSWQVTKVKKSPEGIFHFVEGVGVLPPAGSEVNGKIDWEYRYKLMRTHTAMHILCGVVFRDYNAQVTGGDMESLKGRMDFEFENLSKDLVGVIEEAVNKEVQSARDVRVKILPRDEAFQIPDLIRTKINLLPPGIPEVRTIEIVGLDLQADGGTHVSNTSEVGRMHIVDYKSKGKINKRIYVELDE
jgi:misacylated tRNA(Ala) deacylase